MAECTYCGSDVAEDNQVFIADAINRAEVYWHHFESDSGLYSQPVGSSIHIDGVGRAEVAAKKIRADVSEFEEGYYEGGTSLPQGTTFQTYVVLKVGDKFFKKTGEGDSYSDITWAGDVRPVKAKEKTVVVYDF